MKKSIQVSILATATAMALSAFAAPALAGQVNLSGMRANESYDKFIVRYRDGSAQRKEVGQAKAALQRSVQAGGRSVVLGYQRRLAVGADLVKASRKLDRVEAEALMREIAADPRVEYVEPDVMLHALMTPNDSYYASEQWHYFETTGGIRADQAWDVSNGSGVVVAVVDTGITSHSDLSANVLPGYDFISDSWNAGDGTGRDSSAADAGDFHAAGDCGTGASGGNSSWHGTHVAGTIAAVSNNAKGVAGVAHGAKIVPVRVLGKCGGSLSDIADGVIWAAGGSVSGAPANANPAKVINMSIGGSGSCSSTYQNAINTAVNRGTTVVVAAGNDNDDASYYQPASCANVITVASTDRYGKRSGFSNYGSMIDVAAPGSNIFSTINTGTTTPSTEGYSYMSGTSMATPHVVGVVALMQSKAGGTLTPAQVLSTLKNTLRPFPASIDQPIGNGIINAKAALDAVSGSSCTSQSGALGNGVAKTNLCGAAGSDQSFTLSVPAGATNLKFVTSGGSGDADIYVRYGSAPTTATYDCKSDGSTTAETCSITTAQAGTYYVLVHGYTSFSGVSLTGSYTGGGTTTQTYSNTSDYTINDNATVDSPVTVSGRSGNAPGNASVNVNIVHTYRGDLRVQLVAPDGSLYLLKDYSSSDSADNVNATYTVNASSELLNGTWKLRVTDNATNDTGYINSWSITF
ncbi:S8 family peptidase [Lysobacter fragariae]